MCKILIPQTSCYEKNASPPSQQMQLDTKILSINVSTQTTYFSLHCDLTRIFFMIYLHVCEYNIDDKWGYFLYHTCHTILAYTQTILYWGCTWCTYIYLDDSFYITLGLAMHFEALNDPSKIFSVQRKQLWGSMFIWQPILEIKRKVSNRIRKSG